MFSLLVSKVTVVFDANGEVRVDRRETFTRCPSRLYRNASKTLLFALR